MCICQTAKLFSILQTEFPDLKDVVMYLQSLVDEGKLGLFITSKQLRSCADHITETLEWQSSDEDAVLYHNAVVVTYILIFLVMSDLSSLDDKFTAQLQAHLTNLLCPFWAG
eukprot:TRINITY_DN67197_c3_g8_i1.p1 TRINITY_DN67197_c3_g8~~TRINITY_DN67197_c3_g8_i1.p1  ORF type:complete len:112 (-),score=16.22 TRINITY_DN67197_c3_g8_i1:46-381(-)